jgi:hypothetical protein
MVILSPLCKRRGPSTRVLEPLKNVPLLENVVQPITAVAEADFAVPT